jgi:hypothetical protein
VVALAVLTFATLLLPRLESRVSARRG